MADKCDPLRSTLRSLELQLKNTPKFEQESIPGEKNPPKPRISGEWKKLDGRVRNTRLALRACEESLLSNTPVPVTLTLTRFVCLDQSDELRIFFGINIEDDEPYALVFAVDIKLTPIASLPVGAVNSKMTLIGALSDVDEGEEYSAPANVIWGLSNAPSLVSSADNLIVLVAMMENDSGSPAQARTTLEAAAKIALVANVGLLSNGTITRQELVSRMIGQMDGVMGAAKVGVPNPDDNIGAIQELRFSQADLDHIYRSLGPIEKSLTFEGDDAKYVLRFRIFR